MGIQFGAQQKDGIESVLEWYRKGQSQVFYLAGYAGTGKTMLSRHLVESTSANAVYAAYTGKAAMVMRKSGCDDASTIHSLIYKPVTDPLTGEVTFEFNHDGHAAHADIIVIDECSMVGEDIGKDLLSFGNPVLVIGDPAQLPPVKSAGFFTNGQPDVMLTDIHRQAEGNPIIELATMARNRKLPSMGRYGSSVVVDRRVVDKDPKFLLEVDQILVGRNRTRSHLNHQIRKMLGRESVYPVEGDRMICLKNDKTLGIFNGGMFTVTRDAKPYQRDKIRMSVRSEDFPDSAAMSVRVRREFFDGGVERLHWRDMRDTEQFDYGTAITVHKSQGSQWDKTVLYDESEVFGEDWWRHLYTGITRASDRMVLAR